MEQRYYTASHMNNDVLKKSSSGGIFTALTDKWFSEYGEKAVVYGCILDESLKAKHVRATNLHERNKMCGSKYISSDTSGIYKNVSEDLINGYYVIFSGTPCQNAGLKSFLKAVNVDGSGRLLTVELICHGVGSNSFFEEYIKKLEKKYKNKAIDCSFRAKSAPGKAENMKVLFENNKSYISPSTRYDWFYSAYLKNYLLRPSCFACRFAKTERNSDICIGDNWKDFNGNQSPKHLSTVIVSTELGNEWFSKCSDKLSFEEKNLDDIYQNNLYEASKKPQNYDEFWAAYNRDNGYLKAQKLIGNNTVKGFIRSFLAEILFRLGLINTVKSIKSKIKRIIGR